MGAEETKIGEAIALIAHSVTPLEYTMVTPSAIMAAEDKGSSKPALAEDKEKGPVEFEEAKKSIKDDTPLGEGPFDQDLGGRRYRVHHAIGKVMGAKQLVEVIGFAEQLGYPSGSIIFVGRPDDYLYWCPDNMETEVCRYMTDNIDFPKLETMREEKNELEASNAEKGKRIVSLEAELKRVKEENEAKTTKLMQASAEVAVNVSNAQVKIDDLKDEVNHVK
ncbi:hypothetical protein ZEAMMB73_Zm00001d045666 [Zea mays]|uniref:Uncharacterized protein n=1 Tax=Zea mays TaxID=4577 RepID=A0A1D6NY69_MAIZE|nr:hypothetical protein ZEAMMB73_Zm00001d045666 [Zea mays]